MVNRLDIYHFLNMRRSLKSFMHLARLTTRFAIDRLKYSRGTRLVIGNAMIAALLKAAIDRGVCERTSIGLLVFPHIVTDRAKPGIIAVNDRAERFVNEANSYHRFVQGFVEATVLITEPWGI